MNNTELSSLKFLIGKWNVEMVHSSLPKPLNWEDSFEWIEDAFIMWHWQGKDEVPEAISIIGRNENKSSNLYSMMYHDSRGVSRIMEMSFENRIWKFWRHNPDFSQRFEGTVGKNENVITGKGEVSMDNGKSWIHDYSITYTRIK